MTEAYLYANPEKPFGDFLNGGFVVYDQGETGFSNSRLTEIQQKALSRFDDQSRLIVPPKIFVPGQTTAVACITIPINGGRDFSIFPVGFGSLVTRFDPERPEASKHSSLLENLYVMPEAPEIDLVGEHGLSRRGIASAILHKLVEDLTFNEEVSVPSLPDLGSAQTLIIASQMKKLGLIKSEGVIRKFTGAIGLTVTESRIGAGILGAMLEKKEPWLADRVKLRSVIEELQASFENQALPDGVIDLTEFRRKRTEASPAS